MADIVILIIGVAFMILAVAGSILPVLPGPALGFAGLFILRFTAFVEPGRSADFDNMLWIFAFIVIVVTILDYLVPVWGTKKLGGSGAGMLGAGLGIIAGLFFAPAGLIIGPFLGAVLGEMIAGKDEKTSLRAGFGSFLGFLTGVLLKLTLSIVMGFFFIREILIRY